jgi:hypothetical protein
MVREQWNAFRRESVVNNGYGVSTAESNSARSARRSTDNYYIVSNDNVYFRKEHNYFFLGEKNKIYKATKSSLNKLFPDHKAKIHSFLSEHNIDFGSEADLKKVTEFCNALTAGRES